MISTQSMPRRIEKVLLIYPPSRIAREGLKFCFMPLGISYLAASIRREFDVAVLDATAEGYDHHEDDTHGFFRFGLPMADIKRRIELEQPDAVGISCIFSPMWPLVLEIAQAAKEVDPGIVTVTGGNHPTWLPERCLDEDTDRNLDYIILGEGEESSVQLFKTLNEGGDLGAVDGLAHRVGNGIAVQPKTSQVEDVDSLPFPARDLMPLDIYARVNITHMVMSRVKRNTSMFTSRGCPARCTFCSSTEFWAKGTKRFRVRTVDNVIEELRDAKERFGITEFNFEDDNFTADVPRAKELLQRIIDEKLDITWNAPNGIALWTLDDELIDLMAESGLQEIALPFESGDQETLRELVNKPLRLKKAEHVVKRIQELGIRHNSLWIVGFPGQTLEQIHQTIGYIGTLGLEAAHLFAYMPLPGTVLADVCFEKGYIDPDFDYAQNAATHGVVTTEEFTAEEITSIVRNFGARNNWRLLVTSPRIFISRHIHLLWNPTAFKQFALSNLRRWRGGLSAARRLREAT